MYLYCLASRKMPFLITGTPGKCSKWEFFGGKIQIVQETRDAIAWERGICKYVNDGAALTTSFIMQGICGGGNLVRGESACNP